MISNLLTRWYLGWKADDEEDVVDHGEEFTQEEMASAPPVSLEPEGAEEDD